MSEEQQAPQSDVSGDRLVKVTETCRRQGETIARLEQKVLMVEQTLRAAEEALGVEQALREELERKNEKKAELINELELFRAEMDQELVNLRAQVKETSLDKSSRSSQFEAFAEIAKTEIGSLKTKLDEFGLNAHREQVRRIAEKHGWDERLADVTAHLQIREEELAIYKTQLAQISPDVYIRKSTELDQQLAKLHAERSEEKAALAHLLTENNTKLNKAMDISEQEKTARLLAEIHTNELLKELAFLKAKRVKEEPRITCDS